MATKKKYYLIAFGESGPEWKLFDGEKAAPTAPPGSKAGYPIIVLLPDRHFFYYFFSSLSGKAGRNALAAASLQMANLFPQTDVSSDHGLLKRTGPGLLAYFVHPGLEALLKEHASLLGQANLVTTPFVLAWSAASAQGSDFWVWESRDGFRAVFADNNLHYMRGGEQELAARLEGLETEGDPLRLDLDKSLDIFFGAGGKPSSLRLPLAMLEGERPKTRGYWKAAVLVTLLGALFIAGEAMRAQYLKQEADKWAKALNTLYVSALGPDYGSDPYGKLLFRLDRIKSGGGMGFDTLNLLDYLSKKAPAGMNVQEMSLSGESGVLKAEVTSYAQLEAFLKTLDDNPRYRFTLDQATNSPNGVTFGLKVEFTQ